MYKRKVARLTSRTWRPKFTPAERLDALYRVAQAARLFMRTEADPNLDTHARALLTALDYLDIVESHCK